MMEKFHANYVQHDFVGSIGMPSEFFEDQVYWNLTRETFEFHPLGDSAQCGLEFLIWNIEQISMLASC